MNKKVALSGGGGTTAASWSRWEGLSPDVLALIFSKIPADEVLRTVQFVCRSWRDALIGPCCWANIDIEQWCRRVNNSIQVDAAVEKLVRRSGYTHNRMAAFRLGNLGFGHAVSSGRFLTVLEIIMGEVTDQMVEIHAPSVPNLTKLDISYCLEISSRGIEVFGKHCKFLAHLRRTMPPPLVDPHLGTVDIEEEEAFAIANTMPKLHYLELTYARFSDKGLDAILTKCPALSDLDIRGCLNVKMEGEIGNKCAAIRRFRDPYEYEYDDIYFNSSVNGGDNDDDQAIVFLGVDNNIGHDNDEVNWSDLEWSDDEGDDNDIDWSDDEEPNNDNHAVIDEGDGNDIDWSDDEEPNNDNHAVIDVESDDDDVAIINEVIVVDLSSDVSDGN